MHFALCPSLRPSNARTLRCELGAETVRAIEYMLDMRQVVFAAEDRSKGLQINISAHAQFGVCLCHAVRHNKTPCRHLEDTLCLYLRLIAVQRDRMNQGLLTLSEGGLQDAQPAGIAVQLIADGL